MPLSDVYANRLLFDDDDVGSFLGHDETQPTSRQGGKAEVLAALREAHGYSTVVMIGDGVTDMEARDIAGGADAFIGFGGFAVRSAVRENACWFVDDFEELTGHLERRATNAAVLAAAGEKVVGKVVRTA